MERVRAFDYRQFWGNDFDKEGGVLEESPVPSIPGYQKTLFALGSA